MRLAPAIPEDAAGLARILAAWIDETAWMPDIHTEDEDRHFLTLLIDSCDVVTLSDASGLLGFLARDGAVIHALYVVAGARGRGLGKHLMDLAKSRSDRLELWCFQANTGARAFYAREGFSEVEMTDGAGNDERMPDVRLVWEKGDTP